MQETMKRVVVKADSIGLVDVVKPEPTAGELLVETAISGVCGSDTHAAAGHHPFIALPYNPGHEVVGIVREIGSEVKGFSVGDTITVEPTLPCWECKMCRTGRSNICENLQFFGCGYAQGGMADFFTVSATRAHVVPKELTPLDAALIEPLATPVHAERISGGVRNKTVVIIGAGTIGLLMLAAVRHGGARKVVVTDVLPSKRDRALRLGADAVVDGASKTAAAEAREALGESADVVFDCVAIQPTVDQAVNMARKGGTIVIVGVPANPVTIPLPEIQDLQMRIQGSATYMPEDFDTAISIIQSGEVRSSELITARYPLAQAAEAFSASAQGEQVKVILIREEIAV